MAAPVKTNALRLLDAAKLPYRTLSYDWEEGLFDGELVAGKIGMNPSAVFKTLVAKGERKGYAVFLVPVNRELDLKAAAALLQDKKVDLIHVNDLLGLTGYIRGGCSPVGMKKQFPTFMDESSMSFDEIAVSAGVRGLQMVIDPKALAVFLHAHAGKLATNRISV
jgi:Cys-tRNA(Pro)/Cys-tRNA(Cys) deacylase